MESCDLPSQLWLLQKSFPGISERVKKEIMVELNFHGVKLGQISNLSSLLVNRDVFWQWYEIIDSPRKKRILNESKTGAGTEIAFVNKQDDLNVPTGQPGSQGHLPNRRNHQQNQLIQTQDGTSFFPSSTTSQVVVMMLVFCHGRL